MRNVNALFLLFSWCVSFLFADNSYLIRFEYPDECMVTQFFEEGRDIASYIPSRHLDLVVSESDYSVLKKAHGSIKILETSSEIRKKLYDENGVRKPGYQTYEQMLEKLKSFEQTYPQICKLYDIGDSRGKEYTGSAYNEYKHEIWAMKVTDNVSEEEDEPKFCFMGEHHAREAASMEVVMGILENFLTKYNTDQQITDRVNNSEIWFIPLVNPNGHKVALDGINSMWRKNIRDNDNNNKISGSSGGATADGVDLNRNYAYRWGGEGASSSPSGETFRGPSAFSEPETQAVKKMLDEHKFVAAITYHLYSELVLWSFGYSRNSKAPDHAALEDLGKRIAAKLPKVNGGTYTPKQSCDLYPASGITDDYAYGTNGTFCYTIELFSNSFWPNESQVTVLKKNNKIAAMELVNRVQYATLTGTVTSKRTGTPVEALVYVKQIDDTVATKTNWRAPYMSNKKFGRYYRLLMPGTYTVTFMPVDQNFNDTTIANVVISKDTVTTLDIVYNEGTSIVTDANIGNSKGVRLKRLNSSSIALWFPSGKNIDRITLYSAKGSLIHEFSIKPDQYNLVWKTNALSNGLYFIKLQGNDYNGLFQYILTR